MELTALAAILMASADTSGSVTTTAQGKSTHVRNSSRRLARYGAEQNRKENWGEEGGLGLKHEVWGESSERCCRSRSPQPDSSTRFLLLTSSCFWVIRDWFLLVCCVMLATPDGKTRHPGVCGSAKMKTLPRPPDSPRGRASAPRRVKWTKSGNRDSTLLTYRRCRVVFWRFRRSIRWTISLILGRGARGGLDVVLLLVFTLLLFDCFFIVVVLQFVGRNKD